MADLPGIGNNQGGTQPAGGSTVSDSKDGSQPASEALNTSLSQLLGGWTGQGAGVQSVFQMGPTYQGPGATTQNAQAASLAAANNPTYASGVNSGLGATSALLGSGGLTSSQTSNLNDVNALANQYGQLAGQSLDYGANGLDQLYKDVTNDTLQAVNGAYNNSGIAGSTANADAAAQGVASALAPLQLGQYNAQIANQQQNLAAQGAALGQASGMAQQGTDNLGSLGTTLGNYFGLGQLPSQVATGVGAAQDTSAQAQADQYLSLLSSLFGLTSNSAASASASTTAPQWYDYLAGGAGALLGAL